MIRTVLVTGGTGYVGSVLVPKLLEKGYIVKIIGLHLYTNGLLIKSKDKRRYIDVKGDIRDKNLLNKELKGIDAVIHLACVSSDITSGLDPNLVKSINYDATKQLINVSKRLGVKCFIYASSSSVYGFRKEKDVTEDAPLAPITDYSRYKMLCERYLLEKQDDNFCPVIFRPAAVFGYSPRFRMDLSVNKMTIDALVKKRIVVYGGDQVRAQIHIEDITDLYAKALEYSKNKVAGRIYNAGCGNYTIKKIADIITATLSKYKVRIVVRPKKDGRSYRISTKKIEKELGFKPKFDIGDAVLDIKKAYERGDIPNPYTDDRYYNLKRLKDLKIH